MFPGAQQARDAAAYHNQIVILDIRGVDIRGRVEAAVAYRVRGVDYVMRIAIA
jgi:hypothetical protein